LVSEYYPETLKEAFNFIGSTECRILAGGTDLMVKHRKWSGMTPDLKVPVVFIGHLKELKSIKAEEGFISIGSACTFTEIIESSITSDIMKEVLLQAASPAIRNVATIGGNICNSSPAGDSLPLLYALNARLVIDGKEERHEIPIEDFIKGPGRNVLKHDEMLVEIRIPSENFNIKVYRKVGTRKSVALSKLSFVGLSKKSGTEFEDIRLAFGAVGPTVIRDMNLERKIINLSKGGNIDINEIKDMYKDIIKPIDDQRSTAFYRRETSLRLLNDFLTDKMSL
jgi:Aerobic-type carbon monoxide dehydrogenase, middle subunit CoxM/CutM homologs